MIGFLFVVFGIKIFALTQKIVMFFGIGGCIVIGIVLTVTSRANFVQVERTAAARPTRRPTTASSPSVGQAAGTIVPHHLELGRHLRHAWSPCRWLFAYAYSISFIAGEVKRPDKTIILSNLFAIAVPFVFMLWIAIAPLTRRSATSS